MDDGPDVRLVYPHPESHRGHHHPQLGGHERVLDRLTLVAGQSWKYENTRVFLHVNRDDNFYLHDMVQQYNSV